MQEATLTPVAEAFHELPEARALSCGVDRAPRRPLAHRSPPGPGAWGATTRSRERATPAGTPTPAASRSSPATVYAVEEECGDDLDDDPPTTYYALVESDDTDCHYLDPDAYDDAVTAAHAADRMAELIAELEYECDSIRNRAADARAELAAANRIRREALGILRHVRACPADADSLGPAFVRLWRIGVAGRRHAFDLVDEHRPPPRTRPFDPERTPTPDECRADAWREGWDCGASA